ncbi:CBS domain-containing protein [Microbulbifer thermotolerans]|uniref:CBS domain-containing protein n=2 Tax=Microbulbifer thermotolerans TaxID=252514 RepID=A0AB35I304_MICTH|nr:CBS domain-containing protein [Microbulbifer thermotolerans]MCX2781197.1 CBS domain-containing protein [Microbulbifer thermotolerans]MCX2783011.1 CBS domain-containing protein [Microbulbifer thermotolerans]MCX2795457.1 CBS domain-containing protein [Microbulbifer thermotolerans]MCX2802760.1 CBS domain-containing protein [Microbulbifer thermotolerans]MCX2803467.1 CBS domain-containing protein [Microbulbifer thermotolerans]
MSKTRDIHHMPTLAALMTPFPYHIDINAPVEEALAQMEAHQVHHLPVTRDGDLETVISRRDIERARAPGHRLEEQQLYVHDLCARRPYIADIHDPLDKILLAMAETGIGSVLVMREGELAGIVTVTDALRFCGEYLAELTQPVDDSVA